MKDNLPYFSHDNNARRHPKMKALIAEFGYEGYGRFWALNERIAESSGACIDISKKINKLDLAQELGLNGDGMDKFLAFLSDPEIDLINMKDNIITTDRISKLFEKQWELGRMKGEEKGEKRKFHPEKHTDKTRLNKIKIKTRLNKTYIRKMGMCLFRKIQIVKNPFTLPIILFGIGSTMETYSIPLHGSKTPTSGRRFGKGQTSQ
jgi:hypothetical protein